MGIIVENGGILTTVQDEGRFGYQAFGVSTSGAMDMVPVETLRRSVESQYGIAVLSVIDSDDVNIPVRLVHEGHRYVIWYANGLNSRVNTTNLIPSRGRIVLTDSNYEVLPAMEVAA